jgi:ferritin-like metal-binding protein YciE
MIGHIMLLDEKQVETLHEILREFARRHRNITQTFYKHCKEIKGLIEELESIIMVYLMNEKCLSVLTAPWNML